MQIEDFGTVNKEGGNKRARSLRGRFKQNRERGDKAQSGIPPVELPRGYWDRCVLCVGEERRFGNLALLERGTGEGGRRKRLVLRGAKELLKGKVVEDGVIRGKEKEDKAAREAAHKVAEDVQGQGGTVEGAAVSPIVEKTPAASKYLNMPETVWYSEETGAWEVFNFQKADEEGKAGDKTTQNAEIDPERANFFFTTWLERAADIRYTIHEDVYNEIQHTLRGGLSLRPPQEPNGQPIPRTITLLQTPQDGAMEFLDNVVETVAQDLDADLIRLNAQDFAETLSLYIGENVAWQAPHLSSLGYETARVAGKLEDFSNKRDTTPIHEDAEGVEDEDDPLGPGKSASATAFPVLDLKSILKSMKLGGLGKSSKASSVDAGSSWTHHLVDLTGRGPPSAVSSNPSDIDHWGNLKINAALEKLISGADEQRSQIKVDDDTHDAAPKDLIIQIQDYRELNSTKAGAEILVKLRAIVDKKWQAGRNIICVGTTANEQIVDAFATPEIQQLQSEAEFETRTIYVPTEQDSEKLKQFEDVERSRIRGINTRQIEEMIMRMADGNQTNGFQVHIGEDMETAVGQELQKHSPADAAISATHQIQPDSVKEEPSKSPELSKEAIKAEHLTSLEEGVWTHSRVRRLVTTILGECYPLTQIGGRQFNKGMDTLTFSDEAKVAYGKAAIKAEVEETMKQNEISRGGSKRAHSDKIRELTKTCTPHEKKMLKGIVLPKDIKTTFNDIRAPPETIEALKTLTGLSLSRPEAFSYGVLATDKIPGLLLYGPPGTGKTLLAKAVAKESGATVLEISGADVNDMYVGEGEKNVKAVFSLAKKLSPCIVFIDEADAIFAARGAAGKQRSHRELINQFLREWDGMKDMATFIMIATNRPFDLDDAVLRRLPRKLLIDLPLEGDREAILRIHLKDEVLDPSVSLAAIAKDTPFYSGSDLKNVAVAAALACIREENAIAAKHIGEEAYVFPEKRTLRKEHFTKALEEISASVSEDMSTLGQIRKFDERYGDRKGRRKKSTALGFGGTTVVEKDSEAARVRKLEV